eukprot:TRINITY_DN2118_c0_g1_i2.p1 TRINITY_DN2118_c0_g1~~TRINITY_DN2118_c0_g1_i2.p1  ORF type:complete len:396 (-),score=37.94 TRINITY_DN2118_c0_g1_i2:168-1355(-)
MLSDGSILYVQRQNFYLDMKSNNQDDQNAEIEELRQRCLALSQRVHVFTERMVGEIDAFSTEVTSLQQNIRELHSKLKEESNDAELLEELGNCRKILYGRGPGGDLRKLCTQRTPALLNLLLGSKTDVRTIRQDRAIRMKEEYHKFRDRMAFILLVMPALLVIGMHRADLRRAADEPYTLTPPLLTGVQVNLVFLTYFYIAMALRENVLLVNGSNIRAWWIHHHYWSACGAALILALPVDSRAVYMFAERFLLWTCFQAIVMIFQNRYQRRRMYTRIALGKNSAMDVVSGESSGGSGQLLILYPMLFALQIWQLWLGIEMILRNYQSFTSLEGWLDQERHESDLRGSRGVFIAGILFSFLAIMNFRYTVETIIEKRKIAYRAKQKQQNNDRKKQQ